jgi:uncharacterized repeat protein (TIGR01451 family)/fimbrial isopeptide formation D2 family protein
MRHRVAHVVLMASLLLAALAGTAVAPRPASAGEPIAPLAFPDTLATSLVATSESSTVGARVTIGEIARLRLVAQAPEGPWDAAQLTDRLPDGLRFLDDGTARVALVSNGGLTSSTLNALLPGCAGLNVTGGTPPMTGPTCPLPAAAIGGAPFASGVDVTFQLGDLINAEVDANAEYVVIEFNALVENVAGNQGGNTLIATVEAADAGGPLPLTPRAVTLSVVEPVIADVDKVMLAPANGTADAGDTVTYRVTFSNTGATAFNVRLVDTLPAGLALDPNDIAVTLAGGATGILDNSSAGVVDLTFNRVPLGGTVQIDYVATVAANAAPGLRLANTADVTYTSLPGANGIAVNPTGSATPGLPGQDTGERTGTGSPAHNDYHDSDQATLTLVAPVVDKLTPSPAAYTIGEAVTYDIRVTLPEGVTDGLVVTDFLPDGLGYVSHSIVADAVTGGPNLPADYAGDVASLAVTRSSPAAVPGASGEDVVLSFPTITTTDDNNPGNNAFLVRIQARVLDASDNRAGVALDNTAGLSYVEPGTGAIVSVPDPTPETITLVEPGLTIAKSFSATAGFAGQTVRVTLVVTNQGSSAAHDVVVEDPLGTTSFGAVSEVSTPADFTFSTAVPNTVQYAGGPIPAGASRTFTFDVTLDGGLAAGGTVANTASVMAYSSLPGSDPAERTYPAVSASDDIQIVAPDLTLAKSDGGVTAAPGGSIAYSLLYANTGSLAASGVTLTETVPANTAFDAVASSPGWSCLPGPGAGSTCTLELGTLAAGASGNASFVVVVDSPFPTGVNEVTNTASIADDGKNGPEIDKANNTGAETTPVLLAPDLTLFKSDGGAATVPGGKVAYSLLYANVGTEGASGAFLVETVPAHTTFDVSDPANAGWTCAGGGEAGDTCTFGIGDIAVGMVGGASFVVTVDSPLAETVTTIVNTAGIAVDGPQNPDPTPGDNTATETTPVLFAPDLTLALSDGGVSPAPGQPIAYTLRYGNTGIGRATGVVIVETVPQYTNFNAAANDPGWRCNGSLPGSTCTYALGGVEVGASRQVSFVVTVAARLPAGVTAVTNSASIADDGANGPDRTPADNSAAVTSTFTPTALRLVRLTAAREGDGVTVRWTTAVEVNTFGFRLLRSNTGERAGAVEVTNALIPAEGNASSGASYSFVDMTTSPDTAYSYWLVAVDEQGGSEEFGPVITSPRPARSYVVHLPLVRR